MADEKETSSNLASLIDRLASELLLSNSHEYAAKAGRAIMPDDSSWIKQSFLVPFESSSQSAKLDKINRYASIFSTATLKYTDSSPGGNIEINPPPQFTRYADIREPGIHASKHYMLDNTAAGLDNTYNTDAFKGQVPNHVDVDMVNIPGFTYGMGGYYSRAIDDNSQKIHLRFGVPSFNSLAQFFTGNYNSGMASIARAGRYRTGFINGILGAIGTIIGIAIFPLFLLPLALIAAGNAAKFIMGMPSTKFYYLKPTMPVYWSVVSALVNQISSLTGLTNDINTRQAKDILAKGDGITTDPQGENTLQSLVSKFLPDDIVREDGLIDVRSIASRSKRLQTQYLSTLKDVFESYDPTSSTLSYDELLREAATLTRQGGKNFLLNKMPLEVYFKRWVDSFFGGDSDSTISSGDGDGAIETDHRATVETTKGSDGKETRTATMKPGMRKFLDFFEAETADGSDWVSFRVDHTGPTSESFDNSTTPSSLQDTINGMSTSNRNIRFNLADGNLIPGMETMLGAVTQVVGNAADVVGLSGLAMLAGSAFIDIPEHWDSSRASFPKSDYTIRLSSPYGNPISMMFDIYLPLCCLLAGTLPLSTGAQSYTSPFLCQLHDRGRAFTRLGIIDSLRISRGTSHLGFKQDGQALAIDVSFSVKDLSSVMAAPVTQGFSIINPLQGLTDDQSAWADYLMGVCGVPLSDCIYSLSMLKYRAQQKLNDFNTYFSSANMASMVARMPGINAGVGIMNAVFSGTNRNN
jgi:hypothetical protein